MTHASRSHVVEAVQQYVAEIGTFADFCAACPLPISVTASDGQQFTNTAWRLVAGANGHGPPAPYHIETFQFSRRGRRYTGQIAIRQAETP